MTESRVFESGIVNQFRVGASGNSSVVATRGVIPARLAFSRTAIECDGREPEPRYAAGPSNLRAQCVYSFLVYGSGTGQSFAPTESVQVILPWIAGLIGVLAVMYSAVT